MNKAEIAIRGAKSALEQNKTYPIDVHVAIENLLWAEKEMTQVDPEKYFFLIVEERVGERTYISDVVMRVGRGETIEDRVNSMLAHWLGSDTPAEHDTDGMYFEEYGTWVSAYVPVQITRSEWGVLSKYISNM